MMTREQIQQGIPTVADELNEVRTVIATGHPTGDNGFSKPG
jgi:hypothetical protein